MTKKPELKAVPAKKPAVVEINSRQKPPKHLRAAGRAFWLTTVGDWNLESHDLELLTQASECLDRAKAARELVARDGLIIQDRFGQDKTHPAVAVERDAKGLFLRLVKTLGLSDEPPRPAPGRPPGSKR